MIATVFVYSMIAFYQINAFLVTCSEHWVFRSIPHYLFNSYSFPCRTYISPNRKGKRVKLLHSQNASEIIFFEWKGNLDFLSFSYYYFTVSRRSIYENACDSTEVSVWPERELKTRKLQIISLTTANPNITDARPKIGRHCKKRFMQVTRQLRTGIRL